MKRFKKGQSILEYIIVLTAIIAAIVVAASGGITTGIENLMANVKNAITDAGSKLPGQPPAAE